MLHHEELKQQLNAHRSYKNFQQFINHDQMDEDERNSKGTNIRNYVIANMKKNAENELKKSKTLIKSNVKVTSKASFLSFSLGQQDMRYMLANKQHGLYPVKGGSPEKNYKIPAVKPQNDEAFRTNEYGKEGKMKMSNRVSFNQL